MSMLGLKSLPVNHRLHGAYRIAAGVLGLASVVFGVLGLVMSGDRVLGVSAGTVFSAGAVVTGLVLLGAAVAGGNIAAETNSLVGSLLMVIGIVALFTLRSDDSNFLDARMTDVIILFVVGLLLFSFGVYGRVGPAHPEHHG
jgi:hypothetical protein